MTSINRDGLGALQFIDVDGLRLRFAKSEKVSGDPILLFSPWPESIYAFLPTWEEFSGLGPHDSPHSQMAPNICAKRGWAASIWANRLMSGSRRKSVMFGMSS